jgi:hypothetical protein
VFVPRHNITLAISLPALRQRLFGIFPGLLSWGTLIGLTILSFLVPFWIGIFIIVYDLYALVRAAYMSVHLLYAYRRLRREANVDWIKRCDTAEGYHDWRLVQHVVILPTYDESLAVLRTSLNALVATDWPKERRYVVVGFEGRA